MVSGAEDGAGSLAELLCALSYASNLAMEQPLEHGLKTALLGIRLADFLNLPQRDREAVYYGALVKDAG